ncbi:MAG: hypothetical protein BWY65_01691 [Firmicutes bacterium ADurb.Bin373]|nr:MAG: hypothetical protein BWY65_01691 [Firmicutes bacterium ADurb.Bin373]
MAGWVNGSPSIIRDADSPITTGLPGLMKGSTSLISSRVQGLILLTITPGGFWLWEQKTQLTLHRDVTGKMFASAAPFNIKVSV